VDFFCWTFKEQFELKTRTEVRHLTGGWFRFVLGIMNWVLVAL